MSYRLEQVSLANWQRDATSDTGTGGGTASDGICNGTEDCVYKDRTSGSFWARSDGTSRTMETTITYCENLSYGGYTDWRLPTQKELMQAYIDGIWGMKDATKLNLGYDAMSSTRYSNASSNFLVCLAVGCVVEILGSNPPLCVR